MNEENTTSFGHPGDTHVIASDPNGAVGSVADKNSASAQAVTDALSLSALNQRLGKNFPNLETALKSIDDTYSYVGRKKEDIEKEVLAKVQNTDELNKVTEEIKGIRKDMFFKDNPQYADANVRAIIEKLGSDPSEVTSRPEFSALFEKVKGYDENQKRITVLDSNPRLAVSRDALDKAVDLQKSGAHSDTVEAQIAEAVLGTIM